MGRSMRRFKKGKPKVRVGLQKKRKLPKPAALTIPGTHETIEWDGKSCLAENFRSKGLLLDPNRMQVLPDDAPLEETDDVKSALGKKRSDGRAAPLQRLTTMQRYYVGRLVEKYRDDYEAMSRDIKLNRMQHSVGVLKRLCARFHVYEKA